MNNINKTIAALFMAATFLPMSAQTTAKKECCKEKTECGKTLCCKTGCEKMKQRMDKTASDDVNFATRQYPLMLDQVLRILRWRPLGNVQAHKRQAVGSTG